MSYLNLFLHWMFCPPISGVPAPCGLFMRRTAGLGKNLLERLLQLFTTSFVFGLFGGEDAILIKHFQYFVYDIDG